MNDDDLDMLRKYGARSTASGPIDIDVTSDVMATLHRRGRQPHASTVRTIFTAVAASWLIAIGVGFFAQRSLSDVQDPMNSLTAPFSITLE
jgi:hypothetical protein